MQGSHVAMVSNEEAVAAEATSVQRDANSLLPASWLRSLLPVLVCIGYQPLRTLVYLE